MIHRLLVANRGEIARRVFATCRRLGIETVAVCSDADADLPHVHDADLVMRLPGNTAAETYLDGAAVVAAARKAGADAIHPGYGFLSENADFARAVEAAGLVWVGPTPESIEAMGFKIGAKKLMKDAGVPVLEAPDQPTGADLPLLVKASAGGGGRGMRVVHDLAKLDRQVADARAEAASAFGDGTVFVEPYVEHGRHVEVQVLGDPVAGVTHVLGERDCSTQRRHQKVVEEAPAPGLTDDQRAALHEAARRAADAIGYRGAGTVEFLVDAADPDRFWFLEMNTRLQVEHPVTEAVTSLDLVELQLAVAEGRAADCDRLRPGGGHAVEARLYAEDPAADYQPQSGRLATFDVPHALAFDVPARSGVRLDAGFEAGSEVSTYYDAMLAKVIAWAPTREQAVRRLVASLRGARIHGVSTNRDQLVEILTSEVFGQGRMTTDWLAAQEVGVEARTTGDPTWQALACLAAAAAETEHAVARRPVQRGVPAGWRNVVSAPQLTTYRLDGTEVPVHWYGGGAGYRLHDPDGPGDGARCVAVEPGPDGTRVRVAHDGVEHTFTVVVREHAVDVDGLAGHLALDRVPRFTDPADAVASGSLLAPMPGSVVRVAVEAGQQVEAGATVLVLEAMKMQHSVTAPHAGTVTEVNVEPGQQVAAGEVLAVVDDGTEEEQS